MSIYYVRVEGGLVVDRTVAEAPLPSDFFPPEQVWVQNDEAQIGWAYEDGDFVEPPPPPPAPLVADHQNYEAMLERRMDAALAKGDTDAAFQILLQLNEG